MNSSSRLRARAHSARSFGLAAALAVVWALLCLSATGWQTGHSASSSLLTPEADHAQALLTAAPISQWRSAPMPVDREEDEPAALPCEAVFIGTQRSALCADTESGLRLPAAYALFNARAPPHHS